ncbi:MAG: hypothetical protein JWL95_2712 [Gemmatimonadetes bacterium]|nr:hypothetical protein [Gemmatimonadota bacterium]
MKEPRRLLADSQTSELSRSLLAAGRARREPEGARERVWGAVGVALAGSAATAAATGTAAAAGTTGATAGAGAKGAGVALALTKMKLLVAGAVIATAATATVVAVNSDEPVRAARVVSAAPTPAPATTAAKPQPKTERAPEAEAQPAVAPEAKEPKTAVQAVSTAAARPSAAATPLVVIDPAPVEVPPARLDISDLREEAALLQGVRAALGRGDTSDARAKLEEARRRFPNSQLGQEREALDVRIASESGDRTRAASLARAFVEHYPDSPLRAGVESIARAPEKL